MPASVSGLSKLADPVWRRERARKAARARTTPEHAARLLVESWPALSEARRAELRALLSGAGVIDRREVAAA